MNSMEAQSTSAAKAVTRAEEDAPAAKPIVRRRPSTCRIQPGKVKRVMQADEEMGRMTAGVPVAVARVVECFAGRLLAAAADTARRRGVRTLQPAHFKLAVDADRRAFGFLDPLLAEVAAPVAADAAHAKPQRKTSKRARRRFVCDDGAETELGHPESPVEMPAAVSNGLLAQLAPG